MSRRKLVTSGWLVLRLESRGAELLYLASDLAKSGARAGAIYQILTAASVFFRAAQELKSQSFRASHSSDLPPLTARVPKEGGGPHVRVCDSS